MPPGTYAMQIAELDGAARQLGALSGSVTAAGLGGADSVRVLAMAAPGSALAGPLPGLDLGHLADVLAGRCRASAQRVADGAETYRVMEAALQGAFQPAGPGIVPR